VGGRPGAAGAGFARAVQRHDDRVFAPWIEIRRLHNGRRGDQIANCILGTFNLQFAIGKAAIAMAGYFFASSFSMASISSAESGLTFDLNRATTLPSRLKRNFSKFQPTVPANSGFVFFEVMCL
jgi:hypothetical protein